jgi:hypothetical protein
MAAHADEIAATATKGGGADALSRPRFACSAAAR